MLLLADDDEPAKSISYVTVFVYPRLCSQGIGHPSFIVDKTHIVASSKYFMTSYKRGGEIPCMEIPLITAFI